MNRYLMKFLARAIPMNADDGGSAGGSAVIDRGDTLAAGAPAADAVQAAAEADAAAEAERIRAEEEAKAAETAAAAGSGEAAADDGKKPGMIPVDRHKAVLDKARAERDAYAAELAQYKQGKAIAATNEDITKMEEVVTAKEVEYNKLLVEGDVEKATAVMREIRKLERDMGDLKADMKAQAASAQAVESVRYNTVVERLEAAYPALNPDHEDFDKDQVSDVMDLKETYQRRGLAPSAALQKAVEKLMPAQTKKQEVATTVTPRAEETKAATDAAAERKAGAVAKAADAAAKTPPSAAKVGADSDKHGGGAISAEDVMKMDQSKFAKLNEETLARLRGDII